MTSPQPLSASIARMDTSSKRNHLATEAGKSPERYSLGENFAGAVRRGLPLGSGLRA
jgi:hypothetical protein